MEAINERLRRVAMELRRKPIPLQDMIPLMLEAADVIEQQADELRYKQGVLDGAAAIGRCVLVPGLTMGSVG